MNAKQLFAAATFAVLGASAFASEATNFPIENGSLTRAEVKAELARTQATADVAQSRAVYGSFPRASVAARHASFDSQAVYSRDEVRAEARAAARSQKVNDLYVGG